ncbi:TetR/AcrR family transcriptional regulator C-terminal domain-containing protein [Dehalobacter sp. DCM]|uniref:TetR/AcrR family transcriptional regulator C-terminal domain-containing protein n=1 Tax=Dehalobacter sp. DCM TaxID=2907827 RepID=UPI003081EEA1|nr:TetR/AcrR family transcriptional regulator C-terminal domain-containing protein [Dehalobacter sp. DCM]
MSVGKATKDLYKNTLLSLAKARPLSKITLKDILDCSQTAKQTFYNHFADKYALINYVMYDFVEAIEATHAMRCYQGILSVLSFTKENSYFFTAIVKNDHPSNFPEFFYRWCINYYVAALHKEYGLKVISPDIKIAIDFYCHGAVGIYIDWIQSGMGEAKELIAKAIVTCRPKALDFYFPIENSRGGSC